MAIESPFHEGELWVQQQAGETQAAQQNGRIIADTIIAGGLKFIQQQPLVIFGSINEQQIWASILIGHPGFMNPIDPRRVDFDLSQTVHSEHDPLWRNITHHPQVGTLIIDLATRRRLRINGTVDRSSPNSLRLDVAESYPNCPKYIQRRHLTIQFDRLRAVEEPQQGQSLSAEQQSIVAKSDTFFVASAHPTHGVDASHRGGEPGFVQILSPNQLRIPDYAGNGMFNTLGNFNVDPRAGLLFIDFERDRLLQLTGRAEILWEFNAAIDPTGGTRRYWQFEIEQWQTTGLSRSLRWEFLDASPYNPKKLPLAGDR